MKIGSYEKLTSAIDEKTLGKVLDEREKRLKKLGIKKEEITDTKDNYEELVIEEETRGEKIRRIIFKALSVAAAVALIGGMIYVARIPLYMNNNAPTPAASGTANYNGITAEDFAEWIDPYRTDRISMEDVEKIEAGISFKELVDLIGKPTGNVGSGEIIMKWMIDNGEELLVTIAKPLSMISSINSSDMIITPGDFLVKGYTAGEKTVYFPDPTASPADEPESAFDLPLIEDFLTLWTDPDRTDKISMEDAEKIKKGMMLSDVAALIGKPVGSIVGFLDYIMEWEIDNGAALHVLFGSTSSWIQDLGSVGNFRVISCEIKRGPAVIYTPDYNSTSTLHADVFLEKLKNEGYHTKDGMDTNNNVDNIKAVYNITPAAILTEEPDLELFYVKDGDHCFMMYKGEIYRYETFGGYHHRLALWDYDDNGVKDLVSYYSWGSGILRFSVSVTDLTTMKGHTIITRDAFGTGFSFDFDGENVYIDGEILTYSDGEFHCGDLF